MTRARKAIAVGIVCVGLVLLGAVVLWMSLPELPPHYPTCLDDVRRAVTRYGNETGDYPHTASEVVEKVGPLLQGGALKISLLANGRILLKDPYVEVEIEYRYISPKERPRYDWKER